MQPYEPTRHDIHDWQCELAYLRRKDRKSQNDRRRITALRNLLATHAKF